MSTLKVTGTLPVNAIIQYDDKVKPEGIYVTLNELDLRTMPWTS